MFAAHSLTYHQTSSFTNIVTDYLSADSKLRPFYDAWPDLEGLQAKIRQRQEKVTNRSLLVEVLRDQYSTLASVPEKVQHNIDSLLLTQTFTVCTAHQPNLFTGPLYFVYKIIHAIKLANSLNQQLPQYHFVPVYYMGSEDADFAELNHTYVDGKKLEWKKEQKGAVGRMIVDKTLVQLIDELEGQLAVEENGSEVITLLRQAYQPGATIQSATFWLLNKLYGHYGLVVLIPDDTRLKAQMQEIFYDDIFAAKPCKIVSKTSEEISRHYEAQAFPREINLFYLHDNIRERIEKVDNHYQVLNTDIRFTEEELKRELQEHPERFSPNVILRGIYQETILPNIAFVGGGGELAYWLQLKDLFADYNVPYPVLLVRNSFLVVEEKWRKKIGQLGLSLDDLFVKPNELLAKIALQKAEHPVTLNGTLERATEFFEQVGQQATMIDRTLQAHVAAIQSRSIKALQGLEKKMLRAEKRKHADLQRQVEKMREALFPNGSLQERVENFSLFYAKWGSRFIDQLCNHSPVLEQEFTILLEE
jgi:bacillithiol biosynthesis cysteine-adding enzyme BshC